MSGNAKWTASGVLVGAWLAIAVVAFHTIYAPWTLAILVVAVLLVLASVWLGGLRSAPARSAVIAVTLATPVTVVASPLLPNVERTAWLLPAVVAGVVVVPLGLVVLLRRPRWWPAMLGLTTVVCAGIILGGTPRIDVWVILQDTANGLLRYQDPYRMSFPNVPPGETSTCFNYLPSTFLLTAPGRWLFGDVRWVEAGCVVASAALLARHVRSARGLPLAMLVGVLPCTLLVVQQAWTEPMLLLSLCATAVAVDRGSRWWLAPVALGVGLANKQHAVVLLPFLLLYRDFGPRRTVTAVAAGAAITLPWVLADPVRFKTCVADFYLGESAPPTSLSVWRWLPPGWGLPVLLAGTAAVTLLALRRCPRGGAGLLAGSGLILATFDLLNKQTFANQWWLASALLVAGLAIRRGDVSGAPRAAGSVVPDRATSAQMEFPTPDRLRTIVDRHTATAGGTAWMCWSIWRTIRNSMPRSPTGRPGSYVPNWPNWISNPFGTHRENRRRRTRKVWTGQPFRTSS